MNAMGNDEVAAERPKRLICDRCSRPKRNGCFCSALPDSRLQLSVSHCIVLVHPLEERRSNRSLPFVELCLDEESISVETGRRFAEDSPLRHKLESSRDLWLLFPDQDAMTLDEALEQRKGDMVTLVFFDATWSYAREMNVAIKAEEINPANLVYVKLSNPEKPRRFDIRTPLSDDHWCTAEAIAHTLAKVEDRREIFDTIMKPLDLVVQRWRQRLESKKNES